MQISKEVEEILSKMAVFAEKKHHEYVTPEHLLYVLTYNEIFCTSFERCGGSIAQLRENLKTYLAENVEKVEGAHAQLSAGLNDVLIEAETKAISCEKYVVEVPHLISGITELQDSYALYYLLVQNVKISDLLYTMSEITDEREYMAQQEAAVKEENKKEKQTLDTFVTCLNEKVSEYNPLIGREDELERTIQILCRKYKNNPLHIGEPGVGKTALTYGLAKKINDESVPEKLKGAKIYAMDLASMVAGTQFRGDFEKRFKQVMTALEQEEKPIVYIDEIHTIVGAGASNGSTMDASNLLKPYLTSGKIRFIGATTFEEYKKNFSKNKSLLRRFQNIEIKEPSREEAVTILNGLKKTYEDYHHVRYLKGTIEHAVELSDKYINERALPDKALDLLDEAGAYRELHPQNKQTQTVDKKLIEEVLSKICSIPKQTVETDEMKQLKTLEQRMKQKIFGQDEAVAQLANVVKFSRAGLNEASKPLASLLFVGPTGVGKTEVAKVLSELMGMKLVRFDMSEYAEKHTVAKLIGSPAGYVGYEEGGLLTEAIRKNSYCILLLDEIEKAHADIFNVLLQVMDYATLTDNQGMKADFRNVIIIMTSNAGASKVGKAMIGFGERSVNSDVILEEVKKVFTPEFRNRLDRIITFRAVDEKMAEKIVEKKLAQLSEKTADKNIFITVSKKCKEYIKNKGISQEYGAREIDRIIHTELKPLLVDEILFGKLKKGGVCLFDYEDGKVVLKKQPDKEAERKDKRIMKKEQKVKVEEVGVI